MGRFIYHYHATANLSDGEVVTIDGVARMAGRVENMKDYSALKCAIGSDDSIPPRLVYPNLVITSLSYLGREFDDPAV